MQKKLRKLTLSRETLLHLDGGRLEKVTGGLSIGIRCSSTCSDAAPCTGGSGDITACETCTLYTQTCDTVCGC